MKILCYRVVDIKQLVPAQNTRIPYSTNVTPGTRDTGKKKAHTHKAQSHEKVFSCMSTVFKTSLKTSFKKSGDFKIYQLLVID